MADIVDRPSTQSQEGGEQQLYATGEGSLPPPAALPPPPQFAQTSKKDLVAIASGTRQLFVGDLPYAVQERDIWIFFSPYGHVERIDLKRNKRDFMIRGYGFVTMATTEQAAAAIAALDKQVLNGRMIKVAWGHSGSGVAQWADNGNTNWGETSGGFDPYPPILGGTPPGYHFKNFNSVYVKFSSTKPNIVINEVALTRIFQVYGDVIDVSIKSMVLNNTSNVSGFAFIHFADSNEGKDSAMKCSEELQNKVVANSIRLKCELSKHFKSNNVVADYNSITSQHNGQHVHHSGQISDENGEEGEEEEGEGVDAERVKSLTKLATDLRISVTDSESSNNNSTHTSNNSSPNQASSKNYGRNSDGMTGSGSIGGGGTMEGGGGGGGAFYGRSFRQNKYSGDPRRLSRLDQTGDNADNTTAAITSSSSSSVNKEIVSMNGFNRVPNASEFIVPLSSQKDHRSGSASTSSSNTSTATPTSAAAISGEYFSPNQNGIYYPAYYYPAGLPPSDSGASYYQKQSSAHWYKNYANGSSPKAKPWHSNSSSNPNPNIIYPLKNAAVAVAVPDGLVVAPNAHFSQPVVGHHHNHNHHHHHQHHQQSPVQSSVQSPQLQWGNNGYYSPYYHHSMQPYYQQGDTYYQSDNGLIYYEYDLPHHQMNYSAALPATGDSNGGFATATAGGGGVGTRQYKQQHRYYNANVGSSPTGSSGSSGSSSGSSSGGGGSGGFGNVHSQNHHNHNHSHHHHHSETVIGTSENKSSISPLTHRQQQQQQQQLQLLQQNTSTAAVAKSGGSDLGPNIVAMSVVEASSNTYITTSSEIHSQVERNAEGSSTAAVIEGGQKS